MSSKATSKGTVSKTETKTSKHNSLPMLLGKPNYLLMMAGFIVIIAGFLLMAGGATSDPNVFPQEEIYSFRRIVLAPIVVMAGFAIEIFAIFKKAE